MDIRQKVLCTRDWTGYKNLLMTHLFRQHLSQLFFFSLLFYLFYSFKKNEMCIRVLCLYVCVHIATCTVLSETSYGLLMHCCPFAVRIPLLCLICKALWIKRYCNCEEKNGYWWERNCCYKNI